MGEQPCPVHFFTFNDEEQGLPQVVSPTTYGDPSVNGLVDYIESSQHAITYYLHNIGAILFRGWQVKTPEEFATVARAVRSPLRTYGEMAGDSPRKIVAEGPVYTSTEFPAEFDISLHQECSYSHCPPELIMLGCLVAPSTGGQTPIVDCRKVLQELDADVVERFEASGIRYTANLCGKDGGVGKSWTQTFETDQCVVVDAYATADSSGGVQLQWSDAGETDESRSLRITELRQPTATHGRTGARVWHCQADQWHVSSLDADTRDALLEIYADDLDSLPKHATFGDGSAIADEDLDHVRDVMNKNTVEFDWQEGDVLIVDNTLVAHGRRPFEGDRLVVVALA